MPKSRYPGGANSYETPFGRSRARNPGSTVVGGQPLDIAYQMRVLQNAGPLGYGFENDAANTADVDQALPNSPPPGADASPIVDPYKYGEFINVNVIVATTSIFVLPRPQYYRIYLLIQNNNATGNLYIGFNSFVTVTNGIQISAQSFYEMDNIVPQNDIYMVTDQAAGINIAFTYCHVR